MPEGLKRYYGTHHLHFITCSCYHREPRLGHPEHRDLFLKILEHTRQRYQFVVVGYVVMPEHFHLLISEPEKGTPSTVMQVLKQRLARRILARGRSDAAKPTTGAPSFAAFAEGGSTTPFWSERFYDFNVYSDHNRTEKLRYMHQNPVKRGLVEQPDEGTWSSSRSYVYGEEGKVRINQWPQAVMKKGMKNKTA